LITRSFSPRISSVGISCKAVRERHVTQDKEGRDPLTHAHTQHTAHTHTYTHTHTHTHKTKRAHRVTQSNRDKKVQTHKQTTHTLSHEHKVSFQGYIHTKENTHTDPNTRTHTHTHRHTHTHTHTHTDACTYLELGQVHLRALRVCQTPFHERAPPASHAERLVPSHSPVWVHTQKLLNRCSVWDTHGQ
jgi:hypothetical protein